VPDRLRENAHVEVANQEALTERFGHWPSFHDAEIYALRLDSGQRADGIVRLELDIHVFEVDGELPSGRSNFVKHTLVTFGFEEVEAQQMEDFGPQNVLDDLVLEEVSPAGDSTDRGDASSQQRARRELTRPRRGGSPHPRRQGRACRRWWASPGCRPGHLPAGQ
jgi:hypothetical protein